MTELIDNNRLLLETKIKPEIVDIFVNELIKTKQIKYLILLKVLFIWKFKALINCDGQAIVSIQRDISKRVLDEKIVGNLIP